MNKKITALLVIVSTFSFAQKKENVKEKQIDGVTITKTKKAIEQKADRTIFDFSEQPSLNSGSVIEGVKKLPGVVVSDAVGIMYQGKPLDVYMDGRPLNISSNELNAFLEGMPANSIERIEVITNPGAEFPATSGGAIMNIITSKTSKNYLSAVYNGGYRFTDYDKYRSKFNNSVALNSRNQWFGWQLNLGQSYRESLSTNTIDILTNNYTDRVGRSYFLTSAFTFDIGKDRLILNYDIRDNNNSNTIIFDNYLGGNTFTSFDNSQSKGLRQEAVATYQKKFTDKSQKLDFQFTYSNNNSSFIQNNLNSNSVSLDNTSDFNLYNFKIDYSQGIKILDGGKISLGALYDNQTYTTASKGITNLDYTRYTFSSYGEAQAKLKKFTFTLGARAENYDISGTTVTKDNNGNLKTDDLIPFKKFKFFPNASVQYNIFPQAFFKINYNKKINLPSVSLLNPNNTVYQGSTVITNGNPYLQPTIYDNLEAELNAFDYMFIGYNTSWVNNQIVQKVSRDGNVIVSSQAQINQLRTHNFKVGFPLPFAVFSKSLKEIFASNPNPDKYNYLYFYLGYQLQDMPDIKSNGFWIYNLMGQFILPKNIKMVANYSYVAPRGNYYYFDIKYPLHNSFDINISKKFLKDRLSVSVFANDIFNQNKTKLQSFFGNVNIANNYDSRNFGFTLNYKIPTRNKLAKEDPTLINNQEKKDDNSDLLQKGQ
jgi:outer membrane receptor protein involved in Fe transport